MKVRRKRRFEETFSRWYIVDPGSPLHNEGLAYEETVEQWQEGRFNASREEYKRTVEAKAGYLHFSSCYWEREPTQEIFDAFCEMLIEEHRRYVDWHNQRAAKFSDWGELIPLVLPKGTCRMIENYPYSFYWRLTPREYETDYPYIERQ